MASEQTFSEWYFAYCQANNRTPSMEEVWNAARPTQAPAATEAPSDDMQINGEPATAHSILAALVDIHDDEVSAPPEHRCYIPGAYSDTLDMARRFLAVGASVQPVQASLSDEQIVRSLVSSRSERQQRIAIKDMASGGEMIVTLEDLRAIAVLASSTPTTGDAS